MRKILGAKGRRRGVKRGVEGRAVLQGAERAGLGGAERAGLGE